MWHELDTNIASLTTRADLMRELGLGTRRGVLIAGPPGVGKSAISRIVAAELVGRLPSLLSTPRLHRMPCVKCIGRYEISDPA